MKNQKQTIIWIIIILLLALAIVYFIYHSTNNSPTITIKVPNPASQYCEQNGGTLDIRTDANGGQYGICMKDGKECDEWEYLNGECQL